MHTYSFANSEDQDEMPHHVAFHQGSTLFAKEKTIFTEWKAIIYLEIITRDPLILNKRPSKLYCIKPEGKTQ